MVALTDVRRALDRVHDPELDQSLIALDFVADVRIAGAAVEVDLRLPTYFCAPNFAWTMAADAHEQVRALDGVEQVHVTLLDHMAGQEISEAVAAGKSFDEAFPGLVDGGDLAQLREQFQRKAFVVRQERIAGQLRALGHTPEQIAAMRYADLPEVPDSARYRELRETLGLPTDPDAGLLLHPDGREAHVDEAARLLIESRLTRVSVEGNADFCQGMLATRSDHDAIHGSTDRGDLPAPARTFVPTGAA